MMMKKILVAEDDRHLCRSVDILLTLDGYHVISVYDGEEALYQICRQKFDLLITDIVMPRLDGVELVNRIRTINPDIPILVVSGNINEQFEGELRRAGVQLILPKPINPSLFRKAIGRIMGGNSPN